MDAWRLVGRDEELAQLRRMLEGADCVGVVIVGPAGVGKTRLALETMALAEHAGYRALRTIATKTAAELPLGAFAHLLRCRAEPDLEPADQAGFLRRASTELSERPDDRRLCLLVDDAHLLDHLSAMLVAHLITNQLAFVLMTVRSGEPAPELVTSLWKEGLVERLDLTPLSDTAARALVNEALGGPLESTALNALVARSGGNVLYLREMVRGALTDRTLERSDGGEWRLSRELHPSRRLIEMVEARLGTLTPVAEAVLEVVAFGEPIGWAELEELADSRTARELERDGIIDSRFDGRRVEVRLAHPLYGDIIRPRTGAIRVREIMRSLAEAVERTGARRREDILRVATWRLVGGGGSSRLMLEAAHTARQRYDFPLAERLVQAALDAGPEFEARLLAAQLKYLQGHSDEAEAALSELNDDAIDDSERCKVATARLDNFNYAVRYDESQRVAVEAEQHIESSPWREEILARRTWLLLTTRGPRATAEIGEPILGQVAGSTWAITSLPVGYALMRMGRISDALVLTAAGHAAHLALPEPVDWHPWFHLWIRSEALWQAGRISEGRDLAQRQYEQAVHEASPEAQALFGLQIARQVVDRGYVRHAFRLATEAVGLFRGLGRSIWLRDALQCLTTTAAMCGDSRTAREHLAELDNLPVAAGMYSVVELDQARAWVAAAEGDTRAAQQHFSAAATRGEDIGDLTGAMSSLHGLARHGDPRKALPRMQTLVHQVEGELSAARVDHAVALVTRDGAALDAVATLFEGMGADLLAAEASAAAAAAWRSAGLPRKAATASRAAAQLSRRCESPSTPALLSSRLSTDLTRAELETARLAAVGHANKEIAATLNLSVRSIENRLQHVYEKLGIMRRTQLAEALRRDAELDYAEPSR